MTRSHPSTNLQLTNSSKRP